MKIPDDPSECPNNYWYFRWVAHDSLHLIQHMWFQIEILKSEVEEDWSDHRASQFRRIVKSLEELDALMKKMGENARKLSEESASQ